MPGILCKNRHVTETLCFWRCAKCKRDALRRKRRICSSPETEHHLCRFATTRVQIPKIWVLQTWAGNLASNKYQFYRPGPEMGQAITIHLYTANATFSRQKQWNSNPRRIQIPWNQSRDFFVGSCQTPRQKHHEAWKYFFNFEKKQKINVSFFRGNVNCMKFSLHVHSCLRIKQTVHGFKKIMTGIIAFIDCRWNWLSML